MPRPWSVATQLLALQLGIIAVVGPLGGGEVEVEVVEGPAELRVEVRDSGPGVAPELVEEVFARGFTTKAAGDGRRGFGLALTRAICVRRGGSVSVRNDGAVRA